MKTRIPMVLILVLAACPAEQEATDGGRLDSSAAIDATAQDGASTDADPAQDAVATSDGAVADTWVLHCPDDDLYEPNDDATSAAPLTHPGPVAETISCDAEDWYRITVPANFGLSSRLTFSGAADLDLYVYLASDAVNPLDSSTTDASIESVVYELFPEATDILLRVVNNDSPETTEYQLMITFFQAGTCATDTEAEPNDSPAEAAPLTPPGVFDTLHACDEDDWYGFTVAADNGLSVELDHDPTQAQLDLYLATASDPGNPLVARTEYAPHKLVTHEIFDTDTDVRVLVRNASYPGPRADYTLTVDLHPGGYCVDDGHEPNDDSGAATNLGGGLLAGVLCRDNEDYYSFTLDQPGPRSRVTVGSALPVELELTAATGGGAIGTPVRDEVSQTTTIVFESQAGTTYVLRVAKASGVDTVGLAYAFQAVKGTPPANDTCQSAAAVTLGQEMIGTTVNAFDDVTFTAAGASCTGSDSDGADVFYAVTVPAGQALSAQLVSNEDLLAYLVDGCATRCCFAGVDEEGADPLNDVTETLRYVNTSGAEQQLYLGVDSRGPAIEGDFRLTVSLGGAGGIDGGSGTCMPDQAVDGGAPDAG